MSAFRRTSFGLQAVVRPAMRAAFASRIVARLRAQHGVMHLPPFTFLVPHAFGFCHGVERAIGLAFEARSRFPEARLFLTDEIVHNEDVNRHLVELGYRFLEGRYADGATLSELGAGDVLVVPAFGMDARALEAARDRGAYILDTTCGEVMAVWRRVREYARTGRTTLIHGTFDHQETRATLSRVSNADPFSRHSHDGPAAFLAVRDLSEADVVCRFVEGSITAATLLERFRGRCSPAFDPARDLERIGIVNQTTMAAADTHAIQKRFQAAYAARHGLDEATERVLVADTICTATQERQDALVALLDTRPDCLLVVGGYNSSNTAHLLELGVRRGIACFHVAGPERLTDRQRIRHRDPRAAGEIETHDWWPVAAAPRVAFAAGASTPDSLLGEVILRFAALAGLELHAGARDPQAPLGPRADNRASRSDAAAHSPA